MTAPWASSPSIESASQSRAWPMVSCQEMSRHQFSCCFAYRVVSGSLRTSFSTHSSTTASSSAAGTARLTSPHSAACAAGTSSQSRIISRARRSPIMIGSHWVAPPAGTEPCSSPTWRMKASSTITERSQPICSSLPPPTAIPFTRAIVGLPISRSRSCMSLKAPNHFQYSFEFPSRSSPHARRSAPTQNARPVPVTTTTLISSSQDASSNARASSRSIRKSKAFSTSGRFSVTVARG